jgi:hypothetical protein
MTTIEIVISPKGETRVETKGFSGPVCRDASKFIETALGQRLSEQPTAELYQTDTVQQFDQQRA